MIEDEDKVACAGSDEVEDSTKLVDGTSAEVDNGGSSMLVDNTIPLEISSLVSTGGGEDDVGISWLELSPVLETTEVEG